MSVRCWPHFSSAFQVEKVLTLHELSSSTLHHTQGCSALDGQGLQPGLEKLYEMILKRKKMLRHSKKKRWGSGTEAVLGIKMTLWTTICLRMFSADMSVTLLELQSVKPEGNLSVTSDRLGCLQPNWNCGSEVGAKCSHLPSPFRHLGRPASFGIVSALEHSSLSLSPLFKELCRETIELPRGQQRKTCAIYDEHSLMHSLHYWRILYHYLSKL